jgi:hypothetical protein
MPPKNNFVTLVALGIIFMVAACNQRHAIVPRDDIHVLESYRSLFPPLISISPDETRLVARAKYNDGPQCEGLIVKDAVSGAIHNSIRSDKVMLRITWRPDSRAIAYFVQHPGSNLRSLVIWDLDSNTTQEMPVSAGYAQSLVKWAPDGRKIAFASDRYKLVVCDTIGQSEIAHRAIFSKFDWSPDSRRIALITQNQDSQAITILDSLTGSIIEEIPRQQASVTWHDIAWYPSENILLLSTDVTRPSRNFLMEELDLRTREKKELATPHLPASNSLWMPAKAGLLWHEQGSGNWKKIVFAFDDARKTKEINLDGELNYQTFLTGDDGFAFTLSRPDLWQLFKIPFNGQIEQASLIGEYISGSSAVPHSIPTLDGQKLRAFVSKARPTVRNKNAALIRLYWNDAMNTVISRQAETALFLRYGVQCIHLDIRKNHEAEDLLAACYYAKSELGVPRERIVLLGGSNGAAHALEAALRDPDAMGIVVIEGLLRRPELGANKRQAKSLNFKTLAFHGQKDRLITPKKARNFLEDALGKDAIRASNGLWHTFEAEDHVLHLDRSQGIVFSTILHELGLLPIQTPSNKQ